MTLLDPVIAQAIAHAAELAGVPEPLVRAVAYVESRYNPRAVSPVGALGLMQLMPDTARQLGVSDPFNPVQSAEAGARMLASLRSQFGDWFPALAAYNWGPSRVRRHPRSSEWPEGVQRYVAEVAKRAALGPVPFGATLEVQMLPASLRPLLLRRLRALG